MIFYLAMKFSLTGFCISWMHDFWSGIDRSKFLNIMVVQKFHKIRYEASNFSKSYISWNFSVRPMITTEKVYVKSIGWGPKIIFPELKRIEMWNKLYKLYCIAPSHVITKNAFKSMFDF